MTSHPACVPDVHGRCAVCGDEALPAEVRAIDEAAGTADAVIAGQVRTVAIDLLDGLAVGDTILVHQGFAIGRVEPA